jgi:hypothetical protein
MVSPAVAGCEVIPGNEPVGAEIVPSPLIAIACNVPDPNSNSAGAYWLTWIVTGFEATPPRFTTTFA